ncbi:unnamed protein product [Somion occarium]|uniref:MPN domain-containing protein n=1 Tax=Somion occarium TaxID=3059160 RepID=A0ABP1DRU1_9APHY
MSSSYSSRTPRHRPATIAELAEQAKADLDASSTQGLKNWLRTAERARKSGQLHKENGDYEAAFVEFARAATIVLDKLPLHPEYTVLLSSEQRQNLGINGQDILNQLSECKRILVERYEDWYKGVSSSRSSSSEPPQSESKDEIVRRKHEQERRTLEEERAQQALEAARQEQEWRRTSLSRRHTEERFGEGSSYPRQSSDSRRRDDLAATAEQRAAEARELAEHERNARMRREEDARRQVEEDAIKQKQRLEEKRRQEQDGILRRQQEAEAAARAARRDVTYGQTSVPNVLASRPEQNVYSKRSNDADAGRGEISMPVATPQPSRPASSSQNAVLHSYLDATMPTAMPLESPNRFDYDSSTDAEGTGESKMLWQRSRHGGSANQTPTKTKHNAIVYPIPVTTTSPAPPELGHVQYPKLMSQHQLKQGYVPSLQSMFSQLSMDPATSSSSLLFDAKPSGELYSNLLPHPPASAPPGSTSYPGMPMPSAPQYPHTHTPSHIGLRGPSPSGARPPPPIPPKQPLPPRPIPNAPRIVPGNSKDSDIRELKSIRLPRECLPKFLSIARVNTLQNRETCGLLLGKDKGNKYIVSTLLIPKQHSTSDTCTMDEEELVLQFTEERHLITLGWIHTHPTQSLYASGVICCRVCTHLDTHIWHFPSDGPGRSAHHFEM